MFHINKAINKNKLILYHLSKLEILAVDKIILKSQIFWCLIKKIKTKQKLIEAFFP